MKLHDIEVVTDEQRQACLLLNARFPEYAPFVAIPGSTIAYRNGEVIMAEANVRDYAARYRRWQEDGAIPARLKAY